MRRSRKALGSQDPRRFESSSLRERFLPLDREEDSKGVPCDATHRSVALTGRVADLERAERVEGAESSSLRQSATSTLVGMAMGIHRQEHQLYRGACRIGGPRGGTKGSLRGQGTLFVDTYEPLRGGGHGRGWIGRQV